MRLAILSGQTRILSATSPSFRIRPLKSQAAKRLLSDHGMILVLLLICAYYSVVTLKNQPATGAEGGRGLVERVLGDLPAQAARIFVVAGTKPEDAAFTGAVEAGLAEAGHRPEVFRGAPPEVKRRIAVEIEARPEDPPVMLACSASTSGWRIFGELEAIPRVFPVERLWPDFLKRENLINIADQIVVIAILAIGMTLVIITRGIDLSVGSLLALSAVATAWIIERNGAVDATLGVMIVAAVGAIVTCGLIGLFSGVMVTRFSMPPFIVTLAVMLIASGIAFDWSNNQSIHQLPPAFTWLGRAGVTLPVLGVRLPFQVILRESLR